MYSVIICTYNRNDSLKQTLNCLGMLKLESTIEWELIVVNNSNCEVTKEVCEGFVGILPIRYHHEKEKGLSRARNAGVRVAKGETLIFIDDDIDVTSGWLNAYNSAFLEKPNISFMGGPIFPKWEVAPPKWMLDHYKDLLNGAAPYFHLGESSIVVKQEFFGANMAFRREVFDSGHLFREDLGLKGRDATVGEDTQLMNELIQNNQLGYYVASAVVFHRTGKESVTEKEIIKYFWGSGISDVRRGLVGEYNSPVLWKAPRYLWRQLITSLIKYTFTRLWCDSAVWLKYESRMARTWGIIIESRRKYNRIS